MILFSYDLTADFNLDENELRNNITLMYMELPKALRIRIGHQFSSGGFQKGFMHSCTFLENDCNNDGYVESQLVRDVLYIPS